MKLARPVADACWRTLGASGDGRTLLGRSIHEDTDDDSDVDASDKWFHHAFDERWRWVATFREDDSDPKEEYLHHAAGFDGNGTGSYIDLVVLRDRDINSGWTSGADGTLEERIYYCQNWRADVSALVTDAGQMLEWVKYSAYGVPFGLPGGDADSDGDCDGTDVSQVYTWEEATTYDVRGDIDLDGDVDSTDASTISSSYSGITLGRGELSDGDVWNRRGYAGYEFDDGTGARYCSRHRKLAPGLGRWFKRDLIDYRDAAGLMQYVLGAPIKLTDPSGLTEHQMSRGGWWVPYLLRRCTPEQHVSSTTASGKHSVYTITTLCYKPAEGFCEGRPCSFFCRGEITHADGSFIKPCPVKKDRSIDLRKLNANPEKYWDCYQWHGGHNVLWLSPTGSKTPNHGESQIHLTAEVPCGEYHADTLVAVSGVPGPDGRLLSLTVMFEFDCGECALHNRALTWK